ncbi:O-antigen translocase [Enterobacter roggenkampii]|uniref:O-antigen translocase n=1 Tax=Enterobacter roggenkampii TaxID=1812935 RepID=UPI0032AF49CF
MKKLLKVTASTGVLTLAKMAMGFAIAKVVAIYTGPSGMALLGQIQGFLTVLNGVINAPVSNGVVRYTSEYSKSGYNECSPWWRASLIWVVAIFLILLPVSLLASDKLSEYFFGDIQFHWIITLTVLLLPLSALGTLFLSIINGFQNHRRFIAINFLSVTCSSVVMILLIVRYNIQGAILAAAIQTALIGLVILLVNINQKWMQIKNFIGSIKLSAFNGIGKYVLMAMTSAIVMPVALLITRNIMVQYTGWQGTGLWQSVWKISEVYLGVITIALSTYYLPKLSQLNDTDSIMHEVTSTAKVIVPIISLIAVMVYACRDFLIHILFTSEFSGARDLFSVQLCGDVIKIVAWLYAFPMLSRCAVKWYLFTEVFFGIIFVVLSYILIPIFLLHGANYAYLISYIVYAVVIITNVRRILA